MTEPENWLLISRLRVLLERLGAADENVQVSVWRDAEAVVSAAGASEDAAVALPVLERDASALAALLVAWDAKATPLTAWDQAVLKRAMNAYKKRLKLARADDEYSSSRNPLSRGASSAITGIRPPEQYADDVWALLVRHGRLRDGGPGLFEPAGDGAS